MLGKADVSGRMVKWVVELEQFEISYEPQNAIKALALVDFLQETTRLVKGRVNELYVDGSATKKGPRAGIILVSPDKDELEFAVRFQF